MNHFDSLDKTQQTALLISAKTRHFLDGSPQGNAPEVILAYAHRLAEDETLVTRLTQAYAAKQARQRNPLATLGSFGF